MHSSSDINSQNDLEKTETDNPEDEIHETECPSAQTLEELLSPKDPEQVFKDKLNAILERLQALPDDAQEIKLPEVKQDTKSVYTKLCKALKVPMSSTFLQNIENEEMDFSYHCLGQAGIIAVTKSLVPNTAIKRLNFSCNKLGARSLPAITSLLNQNENISHLNLSNNGIGKNSAQQLSSLISVCHSVEFLDLSSNDLGDEELVEIGMSLAEIDSIKELDLSRNDFSSVSGSAFGSSIAKCTALERLHLGNNHIEEGASAVFSSLKKSNLKYLDLSRNGIPDEAIPPLAAGLRNSKSLTELDLSGNYITDKGVKPLASGLKGSSCLEIIRLANNPFQGAAANIILRSVGGSLKLLDLSGIKGDLAFMKTLRKSGENVQVIFGSEIRYDLFPRGYRTPKDDSINDSNALEVAQKLADEKGVSLKNVFKSIHAGFLAQKAAEETEESDESGDEKDNGLRHLTGREFARALSESQLSAPKALAQELANALCNEDGLVNMWEVISKLKWRPDDIAIKIKTKKPTPKEKKDKGKSKGKKK